MNDQRKLSPLSPSLADPPEPIRLWVKMLTGIAATTIGALPIALRLFMANLDNVSGAEFIGPMIAYAVLFVAVLAIRLVQLAHARETDVDCMIARASLVPGGLNIIAFTVSPFLDGGAQ